MKHAVYIRPLVLDDAQVSYQWRNDAEVWELTEFKPDKLISLEMEEEWLKSKLTNNNEKRFAICLAENHKYIGNIQLVNINNGQAGYHIFIGEKNFWGLGIGQQASQLILEYAFSELGLDEVSLAVNASNTPAITVYKKLGFVSTVHDENNGLIKMILSKNQFYKVHLT
ncbi:GNAT family N-acetyltransferase [Pedobacter sp. B4-66]|uniref:GNAT family N-acetyltransferase n=1 Tax=Pedobacter sp. B4-66 TaxID=2817280 RepID=UPI001BD953D1|nr:GNAT family N-acetyltransferase [Pedobacter sp. B4-66]